MPKGRVTLRDVADKVGVHPSTVSRVLSPDTQAMVSEEVAERVRDVVAEMGYRANPFAYSLKTKRSRSIGVLIPDLTNPVFPPIIRGIESTLALNGYTAMLANADHDQKQEHVAVDAMRARRVDGLILATAHRDDPLVAECVEEGIPLVLINRFVEGMNLLSVVIDDFAGMKMAVDHVISLGHRRIAHLAGPLAFSTGYERRQGYVDAMAAAGLPVDDDMIVVADEFSEEAGCAAIHKLLEARPDITAVVTANDLLALGCYDAAGARGVSCPAALSVTGYNDMPFVDKFHPALTTVRIPHRKMGARAAALMLETLRDGYDGARTIRLQPQLVVRDSTVPPRD